MDFVQDGGMFRSAQHSGLREQLVVSLRIDYAELSDADKLSILYNNAWKLFDLDHALANANH